MLYEQGRTDCWYGRGERSLQSAFLSQVEKALCAGDKVQLTGFGSFEVKERAERTGRNPKTNEPIVIPAGKMPVFKAGKVLKDAIK